MLLACRDSGSGPAVLLLHSGVTDGRAWDPQAHALAARYRLIRPDLRGFGDSPLPAEPFEHAGDVLALLDHLGVDRCHVVGSSFGGQVALEVAQRAPDRVRSLVLLCSAFEGLEPTEDARAFGGQEDALLAAGDVEGAVELNVRTWLGPEASEETRELVRRMQRHAFDVQLAADADPDFPWPSPAAVDPTRLGLPALVVAGERDLDLFRDIAAYLASTMPAARLVWLPWAGHLPALERPEETTELLAGFLDAQDGGAAPVP